MTNPSEEAAREAWQCIFDTLDERTQAITELMRLNDSVCGLLKLKDTSSEARQAITLLLRTLKSLGVEDEEIKVAAEAHVRMTAAQRAAG
jgi:hypothetical protein